MAFDFNRGYVNALNPLFRYYLKSIVQIYPVLVKVRRVLRLFPAPKYRIDRTPQQLITHKFDAAAKHFRKHRWAYIENFLDPEFHRTLIKQWPGNRYFIPPSNVEKFYNMSFKWNVSHTNDPPLLKHHPAFQIFFHYVRSKKFTERVSTLIGEGEVSCEGFVANSSLPGSLVVPHRDSIGKHEIARPSINLVIFINGSGGKNSGGLCLSHDNLNQKIIFEPTKLINTCLIYDTSYPSFYHGFDPIKPGKFRKAITVHFCSSQYCLKEKKAA